MTSDPLLRVGQGLVFLKIALLVFVFDPNASDAFSLPKSSISYVLSALLAACLLWLFIRHGRPFLRWTPVHLAAAAVVLAFAAATPFALDQTVALFGTWRRYLGLTEMLDVFVLYVAAALLFRTVADRGRLLVVAFAVTVPVIAYSFAQRAGLDVVTYKEGLARPIASFGQPDILGAFASIAAITAVGAAIWLWRDLRPAARAGILLVAVGCFFVELFTGVRAGVLGLMAGWAALVAILVYAAEPARRLRILGLLTGIGAVMGVGLFVSLVGQRLSFAVLRTDVAVQERLLIWDTSWRLLAARPLLGLGPDNFANGWPAFRSEQSELLISQQFENSTHSWAAYFATSAGLIGLAAFIVLAAFVIAAGLRLAARRDPAALAVVPAAAYLGQGLVGVNDLSLDWTFWLSAGVLAGAIARPLAVRARARQAQPGRTSLAVASLTFAVIAVAGLAAATARIGGSHDLGVSEALVATNGPAAVAFARSALAQDPRRPELWAAYGEALSSARRDVAAVNAFQEAATLDPSYATHWRNLGLELGLIGNTSAAYEAFLRANKADPWDGQSLDLTARLALARGDPELALAKGSLAVELRPDNLPAYDAPVFAALSLRRYDDAERLLRQAFANGDSPALRFREAQLFAATGRVDLALRDLDLVLAAQPNNTDAQKLKQDLQGR